MSREIDIDDPMTGDSSEKWELAGTMFKPKDVRHRTRVKKKNARAITLVEQAEKIINDEFLKGTPYKLHLKRDLTIPAMSIFQSLEGKSRDEWVEISRNEDKEKKSLLQKLAGG